MSKKQSFDLIDDTFDRDAKNLWANIAKYEKLLSGESILEVEIEDEEDLAPRELELNYIRKELGVIINHSKSVVEECDKILAECTSIKEYLLSDAKVARSLHNNLIARLTRVLNYKPAFDVKS